MPHRANTLLWGLAGLVVIAALLLAGARLARHRAEGAPLKRRLVSAGLTLLGLLGYGGALAGSGCTPPPAARTPPPVAGEMPPLAAGDVPPAAVHAKPAAGAPYAARAVDVASHGPGGQPVERPR